MSSKIFSKDARKENDKSMAAMSSIQHSTTSDTAKRKTTIAGVTSSSGERPRPMGAIEARELNAGTDRIDLDMTPSDDDEESADAWFSADVDPPIADNGIRKSTMESPLQNSQNLAKLANLQPDLAQESWDEDFVFSDTGVADDPETILQSPDLGMLDDDILWGSEEVRAVSDDAARDDASLKNLSHIEDIDTMTKSTSNSTLKAPISAPIRSRHVEYKSSPKMMIETRAEPSFRRPTRAEATQYQHISDQKSRPGPSTRQSVAGPSSGLYSTSSTFDDVRRHKETTMGRSADIRSASAISYDRPAILARHKANRSVSEQQMRMEADSMTPTKTPRRKGDSTWSAIFSRSNQKSAAPQTSLIIPNPHERLHDAEKVVSMRASSNIDAREAGVSGQKKASHRKGAASLSLSLGFSNPWSRSRKTNDKTSGDNTDISPSATRDSVMHSVLGATQTEGLVIERPSATRRQSDRVSSTAGKGRPGQSNFASSIAPIQTMSTSGDEGRATSFGSTRSGRVSAHSTSASTATSTSAVTMSDYDSSVRDDIRGIDPFSFGQITNPLQEIKNQMPDDFSRLSKRLSSTAKQGLGEQRHKISYPSEKAILASTAEHLDVCKMEDGELSFPKSSSRRSTADMQARIPSDPCDRSSNVRDMVPSIDQVARRNSLGDFKIPNRIAKAQENIRNNISRVREFAQGVEELKVLQQKYQDRLLDCTVSHRKRIEIEEEYGNWWECAEVLIGLGEGRGAEDESLNITSLDSIKSPSIALPAHISPAKARNRSSHSQNLSLRSEMEARSTSSRASSSRTVDPQREAEILSAMLAGAPLSVVSPSRPTTPHYQSESVSAGDVTEVTSPSHLASKHDKKLSQSAQSLPFRGLESNTQGKPQYSRSQSQQMSPSVVQRSKVYHHLSGDESMQKASQSTLAPAWTTSTDSINTQGTTSRRARLRSAGRAGLQGLKELLRTLKVNPSLEPYMVDATSRSSMSLARVATTDSRLDAGHLESSNPDDAARKRRIDQNDEASGYRGNFKSSKPKGVMRSDSVSCKSTRESRELRPTTADVDSRSQMTTPKGQRSSYTRMGMFADRVTPLDSSVDSSTRSRDVHANSSIDSDWTEADFEAASCIEMGAYRPNSATSNQMLQTHSSSSIGKKRFLLFPQRSTSSSIVERYSRMAVTAGDTSTEDESYSPFRRQSLQVTSSIKPGMNIRTSSFTLQAAAPRDHLRNGGKERSTSMSSDKSTPSEVAFALAGRRGINRPSMASTVITSGGNESTSSSNGTQTESRTSRGNRSQQDPTIRSRRRASSTSTPPRATRSLQAGKYKKLILQADAIPSLLVYVEATKERCQECIELLHLDLPPPARPIL